MSQPLLNGVYVEAGSDVQDEITRLESRVTALENLMASVDRRAVIAVLNVLGAAMREVAAGKYDLSSPSDADDGKWDQIKRGLEPREQKVIDVLLIQKAMSRKQIAAAVQMNYTNCVNNVIGPLVRKGWLVDQGGAIRLKEL